MVRFRCDFLAESKRVAGLKRQIVGAGNRVEQHTGVLEGKIPEPPSLHIVGEYVTLRDWLSTYSCAKITIFCCKHRSYEKLDQDLTLQARFSTTIFSGEALGLRMRRHVGTHWPIFCQTFPLGMEIVVFRKRKDYKRLGETFSCRAKLEPVEPVRCLKNAG